jgi:hypothetical protein
VCGSAASRGILAAGWLGRFPIWRRTRCTLAEDENAGHVVVRLLELRHSSSLRSRGNQGRLVPGKRNRQRAGGRHSAAANAGQTRPREGRTQAGDTRARMPRSCGHGASRRNVAVDVSHVGHLPPGASVTSPRTCRQLTFRPSTAVNRIIRRNARPAAIICRVLRRDLRLHGPMLPGILPGSPAEGGPGDRRHHLRPLTGQAHRVRMYPAYPGCT